MDNPLKGLQVSWKTWPAWTLDSRRLPLRSCWGTCLSASHVQGCFICLAKKERWRALKGEGLIASRVTLHCISRKYSPVIVTAYHVSIPQEYVSCERFATVRLDLIKCHMYTIYVCICIFAYVCYCIYTCTYTYLYIDIHICTHIYTYMLYVYMFCIINIFDFFINSIM